MSELDESNCISRDGSVRVDGLKRLLYAARDEIRAGSCDWHGHHYEWTLTGDGIEYTRDTGPSTECSIEDADPGLLYYLRSTAAAVAIVEEVQGTPGDRILFNPIDGWVMPGNEYASETHGSLKEITATLRTAESKSIIPPDDLYDAAERLLFKYEVFVRQGIREAFGTVHKGVSWYLTNDRERAFISYQDGIHGKWQHSCYSNEVPLWLLIGLFRRIAVRKPLGDQAADETISKIDALDAEHVHKQEESEREAQLERLNVRRRSSLGGGDK